MISIVILTKNPGNRIKRVLQEVFNQKIDDNYEIIVVDSGTTDGSLEIIREFGVRLYRINPSDFGHGKTRNFAASLAKGEYIVMLVQDAIPANDKWLFELIKPLKDDHNIAGVYSKQIPYSDANILEKSILSINYPDTFQIKKNKSKLTLRDVFFSNVSSAIRKDLLLKFRFKEDLIMSEDQAWSKDIIEKGYTIVYNPQSVVYHSHKYSLLQVFRRFFDTGVSLKDLGLSTGNFKEGLEILFKQIRYCLKELGMINFLLFLPYLISYEFMRFAGYLLGQNYKRLPNSLVIKFSHHKYYWDKKISQNSKI